MEQLQKVLTKNLKGLKANVNAEKGNFLSAKYLTVPKYAALSGYTKGYLYALPEDKLARYYIGDFRLIPIEAAIKFGSKFQNLQDRKNATAKRLNNNASFLKRA